VDPPSDPVDPPSDPVDPPSDPVDPPSDPVNPPSDPVDPPSDPVDPKPQPSVGNGVATPVDPSTLPAYSGESFIVVDNNIPSFGSEELTIVGYEKYSPLDDLGRCGAALASCGVEIMPAPDEERGSISGIKPTGWIQASYEGVSGGYLWNRCHLIGWQLSAENANRQNLITGTRYMNVSGMLPFENMIADYIKETGNHVALRVTPIFEGDNLVCSGVQMEAYSIEDAGEGICFNVYCYNVQPGILIDYSTGASSLPGENDDNTNSEPDTPDDPENGGESEQMVFIPKTGTKYHSDSTCGTMKDPREVTLEEAEKLGYTPCNKCYG
jgi:DNA-entry nuclease